MASIRKHGNRWEAKIYVGYKDGKNVEKYFYWPATTPKKKVNELVKEIEGQVAERRRKLGGDYDGAEETLAGLWELYREQILFNDSLEMSEETRSEYEKNWRLHLGPALGTTKLKEITTKVVDGLVTELGKKRKVSRAKPVPGEPKKDPGTLSPSTVRKITKLLASMLTAAVTWGWVDSPHAVSRSSARTQVGKSIVHAPSTLDVQALLEAAKEISHENYTFFRLSAVTGARRGELCALKFGDVDFTSKHLSITKAMQSVRVSVDGERATREVEATTKTKSHRVVPLDDETLGALEAHRDAFCDVRRSLGASVAVSEISKLYIFADAPEGWTPITKGAWSSRWHRVQRHAELSGVRLHDLRHFVGVSLASSGRPLREIMDQLGHSRLSTTEIYLTAPSSSAPAEVMASILGGPAPKSKKKPAAKKALVKISK
jgi:integrase